MIEASKLKAGMTFETADGKIDPRFWKRATTNQVKETRSCV